MRLQLTAHTTVGPVVLSAEVATSAEALKEARKALSKALGEWTPEHETGLRTAIRTAEREGISASRSLVVRLDS